MKKKTASKKKDIGRVEGCQICGKPIELVFSLGHQPVTQSYLDETTLHEPEVLFPLNLARCANCELLQLDYIVDPSVVFAKDYPYRTGLTKMLIRNFEELAGTVKKNIGLNKGDLVVDIGSNDGSLLKPFKERGARVVGVEPTDAAKDANKSGIPTIQAFFDAASSSKVAKKYGKARFITATNAFAHINELPKLMKAIANLMDKDGVFISESQYLMDILEKNEFDTIYHEHLRFYSLKPLQKLFEQYGMTLVDAERITAAGGSIRAYAKKGKHAPSERLKKLIAEEEKAGVYRIETYKKFAERNTLAKHDFVSLLLDLKKQGMKIAGLTSSARSNSLLGFCRINDTILDYLAEKDGSPKIGLYAPGSHIKVVSESELLKDQPPYLAVLSWHIGDELVEKMKAIGYKGKFIIPLPQARIVE